MGFLGGEKLILGYDLGNDFCQISYNILGKEEVETLTQTAGEQNFNIPTVLCKRNGVNQWFYGQEALRYAQEEKGILVKDLLVQALDGEPVVIEGEAFQPAALLTLFVKRSLGLLAQVGALEKISAVMFTSRRLDSRMIEVMEQIVAGLRLKTDKIFFQNHEESFYYYMIHQPEELWEQQALLMDYGESCIHVYRMECNRKTEPVVAFIEEQEFPYFEREPLPEQEEPRRQRMEQLDAALGKIARECCEGKPVGSVFLIGEGFEQDAIKETIRYLCSQSRVFQGTNLFCKGACFGMQERMQPEKEAKKYVFLGEEKLKANIGMEILRQGEPSYYALLDAGESWYEAQHTIEFYVQDGNMLPIVITPLIGRQKRTQQLTLSDLPGTARLRGHFYLESERRLVVEVEDMGFGEIRPASGKQWKQIVELY